MTTYEKCENCGYVATTDELADTSECVFAGNRYEPAEYEAHCPECGGSDFVEYPKCQSCDDEALPGSDDCAACWQAADPEGFAEDFPAYAAANL